MSTCRPIASASVRHRLDARHAMEIADLVASNAALRATVASLEQQRDHFQGEVLRLLASVELFRRQAARALEVGGTVAAEVARRID